MTQKDRDRLVTLKQAQKRRITQAEAAVQLECTERHVRRMLKKLPSLHAVPRLGLPSKTSAPLRLRESTSTDNRSTLEAIADGLSLLEGEEVGAPLHRLHRLMVERVFRARGVWDLKAGIVAPTGQ